MKEIYVLTEIVEGPGGHGIHGEEYSALAWECHKGYPVHPPTHLPAFSSLPAATEYKDKMNKQGAFNNYEITTLTLEDSEGDVK